ncbi:MAG: hypothetical protein ACE5I3_15715, partial [Phycisphaerae bacterium]
TIGLDPAQIRETRSLIRELAHDHTVLLSSHILPEVEATCQRIMIIDKGRIVASGTPGDLRERITGDSKLIAEFKGPAAEITAGIRRLDGVTEVHSTAHDGWTCVTVSTRKDLREALYRLAAEKGWALRELRRDIATLEDFFVKIVAGARDADSDPATAGDKR